MEENHHFDERDRMEEHRHHFDERDRMEEHHHHFDERDAKRIMREEKYNEKFEERRHSSMHTAAFILGILSILGQLFWYISIPSGILAIIFGVKSVHRTASKLGKTGFILGIIGLALTIFIYAMMIILTFLDRY